MCITSNPTFQNKSFISRITEVATAIPSEFQMKRLSRVVVQILGRPKSGNFDRNDADRILMNLNEPIGIPMGVFCRKRLSSIMASIFHVVIQHFSNQTVG